MPYENVEDALFDPQSVMTLAIPDLFADLPELVCVVSRDAGPELLETQTVSFQNATV